MSTISNLHSEWKETLGAQTAKKQALEKERKPLQAELDAFDKDAPTGLWGKLKHQMAKNVGLSPLRDKIGKIDTKLGNATYAISQKAKDTYDHLASYAMALPAAATVRETKSAEEKLLQIVSQGYADISETIEACKEASAQEMFDFRTDSRDQQIKSYQLTKRAKGLLREIRGKLSDMTLQLGDIDIPGQSDLDGQVLQMNFEMNLNSAMFPVSHIDPDLLSRMNAAELETAARKLEPTARSIKDVADRLAREIEAATGQAIGMARAADPEVDALAASITPYLPTDVASRMARRSAPAAPRPPGK
ncbi:MAG: hypothetical protein ACAH80_00120 [Alphaproteobacteria bacterium]